MNCRLLPPQSYCKYNPNNEMRWLGRGVETYDVRLSWTTRSRNSTSTESAFFSQLDNFRIARDQEHSGDHVPQADFQLPIRPSFPEPRFLIADHSSRIDKGAGLSNISACSVAAINEQHRSAYVRGSVRSKKDDRSHNLGEAGTTT